MGLAARLVAFCGYREAPKCQPDWLPYTATRIHFLGAAGEHSPHTFSRIIDGTPARALSRVFSRAAADQWQRGAAARAVTSTDNKSTWRPASRALRSE